MAWFHDREHAQQIILKVPQPHFYHQSGGITFGLDHRGELIVATLDGDVYRIAAVR
jgi:hypothetical protein